jgi:hypothetical protein
MLPGHTFEPQGAVMVVDYLLDDRKSKSDSNTEDLRERRTDQ